MVTQAILLTVYKEPKQVLDIINYFDDDFEFYVHLDKSVLLDDKWLKVKTHPKVKYFRHRFKSYWGSWNILACSLDLLREAAKGDAVYFHLISGQDFPVKSNAEFKSKFTQANNEIYLETFPLPDARWEEGGYARMNRYYLNSFFNARNYPNLMRYWHQMQLQSGYRRNRWKKFEPHWGGSGWWSIPQNAAEYVIKYTASSPQLLNSLKHCLCPEEIYLPTLLSKSELVTNLRPSVRYIKWELEAGGSPLNLKLSDYDAIKMSGAYFARKFTSPNSDELKAKFLVNSE